MACSSSRLDAVSRAEAELHGLPPHLPGHSQEVCPPIPSPTCCFAVMPLAALPVVVNCACSSLKHHKLLPGPSQEVLPFHHQSLFAIRSRNYHCTVCYVYTVCEYLTAKPPLFIRAEYLPVSCCMTTVSHSIQLLFVICCCSQMHAVCEVIASACWCSHASCCIVRWTLRCYWLSRLDMRTSSEAAASFTVAHLLRIQTLHAVVGVMSPADVFNSLPRQQVLLPARSQQSAHSCACSIAQTEQRQGHGGCSASNHHAETQRRPFCSSLSLMLSQC